MDLMKTYFYEYQCKKQGRRYHGYLEIDGQKEPTEKLIRKEIAQPYNTGQARVSELSYIYLGESSW